MRYPREPVSYPEADQELYYIQTKRFSLRTLPPRPTDDQSDGDEVVGAVQKCTKKICEICPLYAILGYLLRGFFHFENAIMIYTRR